ncbi:hypothetical protein NDU88_002566 [Pleurodeles waltl]|uniref:Uncharacterized protein n=1 Tax=Pleurodeles waltl TaxID=8319 RepID=A0AAV7M1W1_PLEWA|nr:hypothetical protein NDU88_002566 [Pleurodeles waltl]
MKPGRSFDFTAAERLRALGQPYRARVAVVIYERIAARAVFFRAQVAAVRSSLGNTLRRAGGPEKCSPGSVGTNKGSTPHA